MCDKRISGESFEYDQWGSKRSPIFYYCVSISEETHASACYGRINSRSPIPCKEEEPDDCPNLISISCADQCEYKGDMLLFHFLVHIPKNMGRHKEGG